MTATAAAVAGGFGFLEAPALARPPDLVLRLLHPPGAVSPRGRIGSARRSERPEPAGRPRLAARRPAARGAMRDRKVLRREADGTLVSHADLGSCATGHTNDMVTDATGRHGLITSCDRRFPRGYRLLPR